MKNYLNGVLAVVLVTLLGGVGVFAQTKHATNPPKIKYPTDNLTVNNNKYKEPISAAAKKAMANFDFKRKHKTYYQTPEVRKACEAIKACSKWAEQEFIKDPSLSITNVYTVHYSIKEEKVGLFEDVKIRLKISRLDVHFKCKASGKDYKRTFALRNLDVDDKRCLGCEEYVSKHYMQGSAGAFR